MREQSSSRMNGIVFRKPKLDVGKKFPKKNQATDSHLSFDQIKACKAKVEKALLEGKVFVIQGSYPAVGEALKERGWLEMRHGNLENKYADKSDWMIIAKHGDKENESPAETCLINRLLRNSSPNFLWTIHRDAINWKNLCKNQIVNRFCKVMFTSKVGLSQCMKEVHWSGEVEPVDSFFPRCYQPIHDASDLKAFVIDYQLTACFSLIKWFLTQHTPTSASNGEVPLDCLYFAMKQCSSYIEQQQKDEIILELSSVQLSTSWITFLENYYKVVHQGHWFKVDCGQVLDQLLEDASNMMNIVHQYWPQLTMDGLENMWILKPGSLSRGRGICIHRKLDQILNLLASPTAKENKFVIQKYIEKPLLIHDTKFDIRQWFLITDWNPLTIWMYKEAYLRFCSQPFNLTDFHESIHLCNNAIQSRYMEKSSRSDNSNEEIPPLSSEHMWHSMTFERYLKYETTYMGLNNILEYLSKLKTICLSIVGCY